MDNVIVVGGGMGGLLVAAELRRHGCDVAVFEASDRPGGVAGTVREDGYLLEPAVGSLLLPNSHLSPILDAADIPMVAALEEARTRFVFDRGELFEVPESPKFLLTRLVSWRAKLRAAAEPWVRANPPAGEESLLGFFTRRFGRDIGRLGANLMAHGVFAGDPAALSIQAAFPRMVALEDSAGSVIKGALRNRRQRPEGTPRASVHVAPEGMANVAEGLSRYLGGAFHTGRRVSSVTRADGQWRVEWAGGDAHADAVVIALPPAGAAALVGEPLAGLLAGRPAAPVAVVGLGGPAGRLPLPSGFGALAGPNAGIRALGILFDSAYASGRAPDGHHLAKGIYGGGADPDIMSRTDEEIAAQLRDDLCAVLGRPVEATWTRVIRSSIPQYPIGHAAWMDEVDAQLEPGLHLAGWGYRGVGVSSLASDAARIASVICG